MEMIYVAMPAETWDALYDYVKTDPFVAAAGGVEEEFPGIKIQWRGTPEE
jgi:hypothetical protein